MKLEDVQKLQGDQVARVPSVSGCVDSDNFKSASWIRHAGLCRSLERILYLGRHLEQPVHLSFYLHQNSR
jgi:hypothetical protein